MGVVFGDVLSEAVQILSDAACVPLEDVERAPSWGQLSRISRSLGGRRGWCRLCVIWGRVGLGGGVGVWGRGGWGVRTIGLARCRFVSSYLSH